MKPQTGTMETMTTQQHGCVTHLREKFKKDFEEFPELNSQWYILRFCRARNFDMPKVELMMKNMFNWRRQKNIRRIEANDHSTYVEIEKMYKSGCYHVDKQGRPIFIERLGETNMADMLKDEFAQLREDYLIQRIERQIFIQFPAASALAGKRIDNIFMIMDLKGINLSMMFSSKFKNFLKYLTQFSQDYYPEMLGKMFLVNAPMMIKVIWSMVKLWLDKKTTDKIEIHNNVPLKRLAEFLDVDKLPEFLGGKSTVPLEQSPGPWQQGIEEARRARSLVMVDRSDEFRYFRVDSDPAVPLKPSKLDFLNTSIHLSSKNDYMQKAQTYSSDIRYSRLIQTRTGTLNLDSIYNDEGDREIEVRLFRPNITSRSLIFS